MTQTMQYPSGEFFATVHKDNRFWLDLETTGILETDEILEASIVVTDPKSIVEIYSASYLVHYRDVGLLRKSCEERPRKMHDNNGLWLDLERASTGALPAYSLDQISMALASVIETFTGKDPEGKQNKGILCGNNVESFDKRFLKRWMYQAWDATHYRSINVSSIREILRGHGVVLESEGKVAHRALADCRSSIELYHECLRQLGALSARGAL